MYINKKDLEPIVNILDLLKLKGKPSRMRTRFKKILVEKLIQIQEEIMIIKKEYADLDEDGNINLMPDGKTVIYKDAESAKKEFEELMNEKIYIDDKEHKDTIESVKYSILNDELSVDLFGSDADLYDYICELFEDLEFND